MLEYVKEDLVESGEQKEILIFTNTKFYEYHIKIN